MLDTSAATWPVVQKHWERQPLAILAFGAQEEHGPHLPLATDTVIATALARRLATALDALLLPSLPYGETWSTSGYPGTVSLAFATVQAIIVDIGKSLKASGVRALIVVNGHFGNRAPVEMGARQLQTEEAFPVLLLDYPGLASLADEICESTPAAPGFYHADEVETSLMLAIWPETVLMAEAAAEYPTFPPTFGAEPIKLDTFCRSGVFGDPRPATAEKGEKLLVGLTNACLEVIHAFLNRLESRAADSG